MVDYAKSFATKTGDSVIRVIHMLIMNLQRNFIKRMVLEFQDMERFYFKD